MDDELEELKNETQRGDRTDEAPGQKDHRELVDAILGQFEELEEPSEQPTISVWDEKISAFLRALEEEDLTDEVVQELADEVGIEPEDDSQSYLLKIALRAAFSNFTPEHWDALADAVRDRSTQGL